MLVASNLALFWLKASITTALGFLLLNHPTGVSVSVAMKVTAPQWKTHPAKRDKAGKSAEVSQDTWDD